MDVLSYPFDERLILKKKKKIKEALLKENKRYIEKKIAILGGSTTHEIKIIIELFLLNYGIKPQFYESEYNKYFEEALFPSESLKIFKPDLVYIHTSNRNISIFPNITNTCDEIELMLNEEYEKMTRIWEGLKECYNCIIIQNNFEMPYYRLIGNKEASDVHGRINFINRLNQKLYEYIQNAEDIYINDINYLSCCYGLERWSEPLYWNMYKYSLNILAIPYLAHNIANIIKSIYGKNKKSIILDLDNTIWGGIIGEDGVEGIEIGKETPIGECYLEFQDYIKQHKELGVILNINSKNDYKNAILGLGHTNCKLKEEDFILIKANWNNKSENIKEIANELNLLPESFVFIDDNPVERDLVKTVFPEIETPKIDAAENYIKIIDKSGFFEVTTISDDDKNRNKMYINERKRKIVESNYNSYDDYLKSIKMVATIKEFDDISLKRIVQLTNKSNQFNLTTRRYDYKEINNIQQNDEYIKLYGKLKDKFGDNGIVSVIIGKIKEEVLNIDLWIMSCRVLRRNLEFAMFDTLIEKCEENGIKTIIGYYYKTEKNSMVKDFFNILGFEKIEENGKGDSVWKYNVSKLYSNKNLIIKVEK